MMSDLCLKEVRFVLVRLDMHENTLFHFITASSSRQMQNTEEEDDFLNQVILLQTKKAKIKT